MHNGTIENRARPEQAPHWTRGKQLPKALEGYVVASVLSGEVDQRAIEPEDRPKARLRESDRALHDRVENRLDVGRRAADDTQDLTRRRLLIERLGEVAVTSFQLVEEAHVLDGDHGLVGEGLEELDLALRERPFGLRHDNGADRLALAQHWHDQQRLIALGDRQLTRRDGHGGIVVHALDVDDPALADRVRGEVVAVQRHWKQTLRDRHAFRRPVVGSNEMNQAALQAYGGAVHPIAEPHGARRDRIEDWLEIRLRPADHAQDFTRRRLLLQRLGQVAVAFLQLLEEAHILDGDDGLVRECLEQLDLRIAERDCLHANDVDGADRLVAAQHWDRKYAVVADRLGPRGEVRVLGAALRIGDCNYATLENRLGGDAQATGRCGIRAPYDLKAPRRGAIVGGQRDHLAVEAEHETIK